MKNSNRLRIAAICAFLAAICLMIFLSYSRKEALIDERDYWDLAKTFAEHGELLNSEGKVTAYRPPIVPWILSPIAAIGLELNLARAWYSCFGILALAGIWFLAARLAFTPLQQLLVVVLAGFNPVILFSFSSIYPQSLHALGYVSALLLLTISPSNILRVVWTSTAMAAILCFCLYASTSSVFGFIPILVAYALRLLRKPNGLLLGFLALACGIIVCVVILGPYLHRNSTKVHQGTYLSLNSGINLLLGNSADTGFDTGIHVKSANDLAEIYKPLGEYEANKRLADQAMNNVKSDPARYLVLYLGKLANGLNNSADTYHQQNQMGKTILAWVTFIGLVAGVIYCAWLIRHNKTDSPGENQEMTKLIILVILFSFVLNIAGHAIFFTRLRFRVPTDFLLALPAAIGYSMIVDWLISKIKIPTCRRPDSEKLFIP